MEEQPVTVPCDTFVHYLVSNEFELTDEKKYLSEIFHKPDGLNITFPASNISNRVPVQMLTHNLWRGHQAEGDLDSPH